jgi:multiple sugar transport system permease protein
MASAFSMLFFTLFSNVGPVNQLIQAWGWSDIPIDFFAKKVTVRGLISLMNFLMWFGNTTILLMSGMLGIDTSLFEAAEVDGATATQIFFKITLPLLRPILIYVMITSLIGGLQMFDVPQILTNGTGNPMRHSMTMIMWLNKHLFSKNYGLAGALSVILLIVTGIMSIIVFKFSASKEVKA